MAAALIQCQCLLIGCIVQHPDCHARLNILQRLADLQATEVDAYRDAEPGKIPHELRRGELAHFRRVPHTPYYGTADATILYIIALLEAWKWLGDDLLFPHHKDVVSRAQIFPFLPALRAPAKLTSRSQDANYSDPAPPG